MKSDTPRTDAATFTLRWDCDANEYRVNRPCYEGGEITSSDFARTLERELAAEQARTVELSKEVGWLRDELNRLHTAIKEEKL